MIIIILMLSTLKIPPPMGAAPANVKMFYQSLIIRPLPLPRDLSSTISRWTDKPWAGPSENVFLRSSENGFFPRPSEIFFFFFDRMKMFFLWQSENVFSLRLSENVFFLRLSENVFFSTEWKCFFFFDWVKMFASLSDLISWASAAPQ